MPKSIVFGLSLTVVLLTAFFTLILNDNPEQERFESELDTAINQAKYFYNLKRESGGDFSNGPCLSNALMPGWVVDIVHNPRLSVDDLLENQCSAYLEGRAKHFIELDIEGNFVRAK